MRDAVFRRAAPIGLHVRIAALIPEHEFEGDGKNFPSHMSPCLLGGSVCPVGKEKPRRGGVLVQPRGSKSPATQTPAAQP
ncbi:hypothetical protein CN167_30430 [Sinorhizobium medicae]|nr:hypothetical protein CN167_30430 [Sinorhizobium medicae]RVK22174.1 hypothetical protein CN165_05205 [Sinorhizobium medicae]